jgi:hypothetical protein
MILDEDLSGLPGSFAQPGKSDIRCRGAYFDDLEL